MEAASNPQRDGGTYPTFPAGELSSCPHPIYETMRQTGPVVRLAEDRVVIARHDDVVRVLRDPHTFPSDVEAQQMGNTRRLIPLQINPPEHLKYRKLLDPLFAPRVVARLEADIRKLTHELVDAFIDDGAVEFASAFAVPLPCTVFLTLLGLPQDDLPRFLRWKDGLVRPGTDGSADSMRMRQRTVDEFYAYFELLVEERRRDPRDDLMSQLVVAEADGDQLSTEEILDACLVLLLGGLDTVTATLTCSICYLAEHSEKRAELAADPSLVPAAVEELLRWESPVLLIPRVVGHDVDFGGEHLTAGSRVTVMLGAANTDPSAFPHADTFDFGRDGNRHLAFGAGVHRCLGSHLARLELRIALEVFHARIPEYALAPGAELVYLAGPRVLERLPLVFPVN